MPNIDINLTVNLIHQSNQTFSQFQSISNEPTSGIIYIPNDLHRIDNNKLDITTQLLKNNFSNDFIKIVFYRDNSQT